MVKKLLAVLALSVSFAAHAAPEKTKLTVAVGGQTLVAYAPLTLADRLGFFKEEGLDVTIVDIAGGGSKAMQNLIGGSADIAVGALENTIRVQAKGVKVKSFLITNLTPGFALSIIPSQLPSHTSLKDLEGKKIGITSAGSSTQLIASYAMVRAGANPAKASFISLGSHSSAYASASHNQLEAISFGDPTTTRLVRDGKAKVIVDWRSIEDTKKSLGGVMPTGAVIATNQFIADNPQTIQAFTNAMVKALRWTAQANGSEIAKAMPPQFYQDLALYIAIINASKGAYSPDGMIPTEGINTAVRLLETENGFDRTKVRLPDTFTNEFVRKANSRK